MEIQSYMASLVSTRDAPRNGRLVGTIWYKSLNVETSFSNNEIRSASIQKAPPTLCDADVLTKTKSQSQPFSESMRRFENAWLCIPYCCSVFFSGAKRESNHILPCELIFKLAKMLVEVLERLLYNITAFWIWKCLVQLMIQILQEKHTEVYV